MDEQTERELRRVLGCEAARVEAEQFIPGCRDEDGLLTWWSLSFADDTGFLGGALIDAPSMPAAIARAWELGCNPGGQVLAAGFRARSVPVGYTNRLLTRDEVEALPAPEGMESLPGGEPS